MVSQRLPSVELTSSRHEKRIGRSESNSKKFKISKRSNGSSSRSSTRSTRNTSEALLTTLADWRQRCGLCCRAILLGGGGGGGLLDERAVPPRVMTVRSVSHRHETEIQVTTREIAAARDIKRSISNSNSSSSMAKSNRSGASRYKSILASPSLPVLFILLYFLAIANTNCDHVGSTNVEDSTKASSGDASSSASNNNNNLLSQTEKELEALEQQAAAQAALKSSSTKQKFDPMNVLREIYFDQDSKVTMFLPETDTVQKFHPNGRYGRRSVDNSVETHTELGKLVLDDQVGASQVSLSGPIEHGTSGASLRSLLRELLKRDTKARRNLSAYTQASGGRQQQQQPDAQFGSVRQARLDSASDLSIATGDTSKLLNCNYSGLSNLYWCNLMAS